MENVSVTNVDGEPPIYREMKPVPVTLESCLLNSEEDYSFNQTEQALLTKDSCDDGELSAEEISSMIMINEGPNALSQEELESSKLHSSIRNSSDIKKILTSDLPKAGRFLSTKSLQKLSGAKKLIKKNSKYANEDETDVDDHSDPKVRKILKKKNKAVKENLEKTDQSKILEQKVNKKDVKLEKPKVKSQKNGNFLEKVTSKKKSLKTPKKIGINKSKDLNSTTTKVLKKKVLENNAVVKKKEAASKTKEAKSGKEKPVNKNLENEERQPKIETKPKLLISRSGRVRKLKEVSDFVISKNKEGKILNPTMNPEMVTSFVGEEPVSINETCKQSVLVESNSEFEGSKENKSQGDLLQSALSESIESWFDFSSDENKGKRAKGKVKIIPKDYDSCFEETENTQEEKNYEKSVAEDSDGITESVKIEFSKAERKEEDKVDDTKEKKINNCEEKLQKVNESSAESTEKKEKEKLNLNIEESKTEVEEKKEEKKSGALNSKKVKPANRRVIGYNKKRRKPRNIIVSSYLKNYGEKIDFGVKLSPEEDETKKENVPAKFVSENPKRVQKKSARIENKLDKKKESDVKSTMLVKEKEKKSKSHTTTTIKRSQSAESFQTSFEPKIQSSPKSAESPASLPSQEENLKLIKNDSYVLDKKKKLKELVDQKKKTQEFERKKLKATIKKKLKKESTKKTEDPLEEPKVEKTVDGNKNEESKVEKTVDEDKIEESKVEKTVDEDKKEEEPKVEKIIDGNKNEQSKVEKIVDEEKNEEPKVEKTVDEDKNKEPEVEKRVDEGPNNERKVEKAVINDMKLEEGKNEKEKETTIQKVLVKRGRGRPKKILKTKVVGMQNKIKPLWALTREEKFALIKEGNEHQKNSFEEKTDFKSPEENDKIVEPEKKDEEKVSENPKDKLEVGNSFSTSSALSIPLKKRPRRPKTSETVDEGGKEDKEETKVVLKLDCERRKSHREIKLTSKIVDLIATSSNHRRFKKISTTKEEVRVVKESESLNEKSEGGFEAKSVAPEQTLPVAPSVENYLQSKMEANASNFVSSWEPGDLVWARFAGNPFWPALILRDPFSNDEYSRVKYLGRLPRPFVHVQFLADYGRRAWGPELYIMSFNGLQEFEKLKSDLPEVNAFTQRKDLVYQQAFFTPKKMEKNWTDAIKEAETLLNKSKDERITYMKIKYPLVKYAASVANGRLVPNERTKIGDSKSPQTKIRKRRSISSVTTPEGKAIDWPGTESEDTLSKDTFECVNTSDMDEGTKKSEKESPKITLKLVRSPKKGAKRKSSKSIDEGEEKKIKKRFKKELLDDDYVPSDSGSNGEKNSETATNKRKFYLFKGAKTEKVCLICLEILENEKTIKCKGACQGLFHKSCAEKMSADLPPPEEGSIKGIKNKRRKKLFAYEEGVESESKESTEKEWRCNDCLRGENPCFVCNTRSGNRQRCCVAYCGKFYHQKCLKLYPQTIYNHGAPIRKSQSLQQNKTTESESPHYQILSCPLHVCHTCASDNPADFNMKYICEKLVKCIKCPSAYHGGNYCVPAGSTILNTTQIICAKHGDTSKKSHVNISWCFICNMGGSLICCEWCPSSFHLDCLNIKPPDGPYICEECESGRFPLYGEVVWVKLGRYRWWPARVLFPQEILPNIMALSHKPWEFAVRFYGSNDHYWLNRGRVFLYQEGDSEQKFKGQSHVDKIYQRAVQEATKDYFAVQEERKARLMGTNTSGVMKPPPYVKIKTNKPVGKVQLGNPSQSEPQTCDCDPNSEAPCSPGSVCLNRMLLVECNPNYCNAGSRCGNQSFEKREYPPLEPYRTERRGWGLRSPVDIPKGAFIIEYVGEVVDDEEFKRRMKRKQETKDNNYYFLTIDKDRMIDAGPKGNLARFMNHSCSPNCETQKWTVNGDTRVGLFALKDIPAGTELTFNYNLDCIGNEKKPCHCEEENCSGFIGIKAKNDKSEKNKMVRRLEKESEDDCFVCSDGGELMVCDVPNCPKVYHLECVNLTEWPNEMWFCPRHTCSLCKRTTKRCCKLCPTAFCFAHLDNNMFPDNQGGLLCSRHSTCAVKPAQTLRKASYVNRNTPVVEYEKPFAEKYRPPPQKERITPEEKKEEILMEPNLTDNTPIVVENPLLSSTPSRLSDGVSVQVLYVDEEGQIVSVDASDIPNAEEALTGVCDPVPKPIKKKKRTNIPRKKLNPPVTTEGTENKQKSPTQGGINFESLMIKSVEDKILDSKLNMDNIYNIIGGGGEGGTGPSDSTERCNRDDGTDLKPETVNKKEDTEVDRSRRSKYFKIITPEKFIKVTESEPNQKKVTDFNYIEFMHPLRSARSKTKTDENTRK